MNDEELPPSFKRIGEEPQVSRKTIATAEHITKALDAADAEASVDRLIAWHFCPDRAKHGLFYRLLFVEGQIPFSRKIEIAKKLLKAFHPDLGKAAGFWIRGLHRLRELRNKLAHNRMQLPQDPPSPEKADGVSLWVLTPTGESVLEFLPRSDVDRQVRHSRHLIIAGVCISRIVQDRALQQGTPESEAGLMGLVAKAEKAIAGRLRGSMTDEAKPLTDGGVGSAMAGRSETQFQAALQSGRASSAE